VRDIPVAWNVQGNAEAAASALGFRLPEQPNTVERHGTTLALWIGPKSWLLLMDKPPPALHAAGAAFFDVSASRVAFTVRADVLAKGCPLDFDAFPAGRCAQSVFAGVNALIYRLGDAPEFTLLVARSFARQVASAAQL
jgi:heterotetrameric sarcosine oxidase gamma subunit